MSSEGEAEAAAESGPGSTSAPGAAAAEREEVSGGGGVRPGPGRGRPQGAKAAPQRGRGAGPWGGGEPRRRRVPRLGVFATRGEPRSAARARPGTCSRGALRCCPAVPCSAGAAGGTPAAAPSPPHQRGFTDRPRRTALRPLPGSGRRLGQRLCTGTMPRGRKGTGQWKFGQMSPLGFGLGKPASSLGLVKWSRRLQLCEALVEVARGAHGA